MAAVQFDNYFATELVAPVAPGDTSIQIMADGNWGALITGGNWIYLTLVDANSWNNNLIPPQTREIVKVTAITGTAPDFILTVTRAEDNTTAQSFSRCDIAAFLLNAQSLYDISGGGGGSGTVTSIATTLPITGGTITTTGTIGINTFVASGASHARGAVPDPGASAGTTKFLREDASWQVPAGGGSVSITATSPVIVTPSPITGTGVISAINMTGDLGSGGTHGLVPAPAAGDAAAGKFLKADATWAVPAGGTGGGILQSQEFTSSGTWTVPAGVSGAWVTMIGGGGGGSCTIAAAIGGGGGGSGELVQSLPVPVVSGGSVPVVIGAKGTGGITGQGSAQVGVAGGDTSFATIFIARGGLGGLTNGASGKGGGFNGGSSKTVGNPGVAGDAGTSEAPTYFGGSSGGSGGNATAANGGAGGGQGAYAGAAAGAAASTQAGGGGGASSAWGVGGAAGNGGAVGSNAGATIYGSGGGGAGGHAVTTVAAGDGCAGYCLVMWIS